MLGFGEENDEVNELLPRIGAILAGRRTYNVGAVEKRPQFRKPSGGAVGLVRVTRAVQVTNLRLDYVG